MKRLILLTAALLCLFAQGLNAQMTDSQVVDYVKEGVAAGKSETQIGKELLARGVTREQAERIKAQYEAAGTGSSITSRSLDGGAVNRSVSSDMLTGEEKNLGGVVDKAFADSTAAGAPDKSNIFGHDIFTSSQLTFEPNENMATPENYKLGPGDQLIIEIWGDNEDTMAKTVSPEGRIYISQIGPVYLNGLTIKEAGDKIRKMLASKYGGIGGDSPNSSISVTLGQIRTIKVNVMGDVKVPGTYRLSSFSTVFSALYRAGGVSGTGSLRAIKVVRGGKQVATVDVYGYLFDGKSDSDIRLEDDDIVIVPPYVGLVDIKGDVKRPMRYEMKEDETLDNLIAYAGGFAGEAYKEDVRVVRATGAEKEIYTVAAKDFKTCKMADGDEVTVSSSLDRFANMVEVRGYVFRPGMYQLGGDIATVRQLIERAGGPMEDAFLGRAVLLREKADLNLETVSVNLGAVLSGSGDDVLLKKNDVLIVSSVNELEDRGTLTINGMVARPGTFPFSDNTTVEDLILRAGGLLEGASTARVDVARRVVDPSGTEVSDTLGQTFTFAIVDGLATDGGDRFILEPYDVVSIRKSPGYRSQQFVTVEGEVVFPGQYVLLNRNDRLSDLLERAGGFTSSAYLKGAMLIRRNNSITIDQHKESLKGLSANNTTQNDTIDVDKLNVAADYAVAIDLEKAMNKPGSAYDIDLQEGDRIFIPEYVNTVRIMGEVMYPNAVLYERNKTLRHYINAAGGFSNKAKRSKVYVVYMNGEAAQSKLNHLKIEPGCTIIVPAKEDKKSLTTADIIATSSAATSLISLISILIRIL